MASDRQERGKSNVSRGAPFVPAKFPLEWFILHIPEVPSGGITTVVLMESAIPFQPVGTRKVVYFQRCSVRSGKISTGMAHSSHS